jgi:predicted acyltransferase (DUF342 family)
MLLTMLVGGLWFPVMARAQSTLDPALAFGLISGAKVTVGKAATVSTAAGAIDDVTLKPTARIVGNATALGKKLKLDKGATVGGICATNGGKITLAKNAVCSGGTDSSGTSPALTPIQNFASLGATACPPAGTSEGDLNLKKNGTAMLTAAPSGVTVFDYTSIKLGKSAKVTVTIPAGGMVVINDSGVLTMDKNAEISSPGSNTGNLFVVADSAKLDSNAFLDGTLMTAETCDVEVNANVNGQLYCVGNATLGTGAFVGGVLLNEAVATAVTCSTM